MTDALVFDKIWKEYDDKIVLEDVSLSIAEGAFVSLIGPSGAGKSTFLRLVLGQEAPSRGQIKFFGKQLRAEPGPDRGVVFQKYSVFPHMSALDNVVYALDCEGSPILSRVIGPARKRARDEAKDMLAAVGLQDSMNVYPAQMSGGMQQRLAIAQALVKKPKLLLLDEPFGALDPGIRLDMHALITDLWREHNLTILMVTHDIKEAFALGTRVLAFDKRRRDPQAPNRYGATVTYDIKLDRKTRVAPPAELQALAKEGLPA